LIKATDEVVGTIGDGDVEQHDVRGGAKHLRRRGGQRRHRQRAGGRGERSARAPIRHLPLQWGASSFVPGRDTVTFRRFGGTRDSGLA